MLNVVNFKHGRVIDEFSFHHTFSKLSIVNMRYFKRKKSKFTKKKKLIVFRELN